MTASAGRGLRALPPARRAAKISQAVRHLEEARKALLEVFGPEIGKIDMMTNKRAPGLDAIALAFDSAGRHAHALRPYCTPPTKGPRA